MGAPTVTFEKEYLDKQTLKGVEILHHSSLHDSLKEQLVIWN